MCIACALEALKDIECEEKLLYKNLYMYLLHPLQLETKTDSESWTPLGVVIDPQDSALFTTNSKGW